MSLPAQHLQPAYRTVSYPTPHFPGGTASRWSKCPCVIDSCDPNLPRPLQCSRSTRPRPPSNVISHLHKSPSAQNEWLLLPFLVPSTNFRASQDLAQMSLPSTKLTEMAACFLTGAVCHQAHRTQSTVALCCNKSPERTDRHCHATERS